MRIKLLLTTLFLCFLASSAVAANTTAERKPQPSLNTTAEKKAVLPALTSGSTTDRFPVVPLATEAPAGPDPMLVEAVKKALTEGDLLKNALEKDGLLEKAVKAAIDKRRIFNVKGQSELSAVADHVNFNIYIAGDTINISPENKSSGELSAVSSIDNKIAGFLKKLERVLDKNKAELKAVKEGPPLVQFACGVKQYAMIKPTIKYYYSASQKVVLSTALKEVDNVTKHIISNGATFSPVTVRFQDPMVDNIYNGMDVITTGVDPKTLKWQIDIVPPDTKNTAQGAAQSKKPAATDPANNNPAEFAVSDGMRRQYETEALRLALEDAKVKADAMCKQLNISVEKITPLVEQNVTYKSLNDKSGTVIFTAEVTLYY